MATDQWHMMDDPDTPMPADLPQPLPAHSRIKAIPLPPWTNTRFPKVSNWAAKAVIVGSRQLHLRGNCQKREKTSYPIPMEGVKFVLCDIKGKWNGAII